MRVLSGWGFCRVLASRGFVEVRQRGSHVVVQKVDVGRTVTAPVPDHSELRVGTLLSIIRQSGVPRPEFERSS